MYPRQMLRLGKPTPATLEPYFVLIKDLEEQNPKLISAAFGKPTYPLSPHIPKAMLDYWQKAKESQKAIGYGPAQGVLGHRKKISEAISKEYELSQGYNENHVVFTVGGVSAIHGIFYAIKKVRPHTKIVTPMPYYPYYRFYGEDQLHLIDLFKSSLTLSAEVLKEALLSIKKDQIGAFVFCDPSNPCGTTPTPEEWQKIAHVLREYKNVPIMLDEAYREMVFDEQCQSLVSLAPDLLDRIILLRSATKGLSAAGERMSAIFCKNPEIYDALIDYMNIYQLNTPLSAQYAYAHTLSHITQEEYLKLKSFYKEKSSFMSHELKKLNLWPKHVTYEPNGTFYLIADLSHLKGQKIHQQAKAAFVEHKGIIETDVDMAYHLVYEKNLSITPLSFFGADPALGYLRITCADDLKVIEQIAKLLS